MRFDILAAVPDLLESPLSHSILKRARDRGLIEVKVHNLFDYGVGKHQQIDDYAYGGKAGMVLKIEPVYRCISTLKEEREYDEIIYLSPDGERFDQQMANKWSLKENLILLCGHYKGVDQRIRDHLVTREVSIGDYVLSGGELAAAVVVDAVGRLIPGVLNDETSALSDSFQDNLLAPPVYTRPAVFKGWEVPDILRSGDHGKIDEWEREQALKRTRNRRPDLLEEE